MIELSEFTESNTVIIAVNLVSKTIHFISTHITVTIEGTTKLFLHYVWKLHSLPIYIVSNKGL